MATEKDNAFVQFLLEQTEAGLIAWESTPTDGEYIAGFQGKYHAKVEKGRDGDGNETFTLTLITVSDQRELVSIRDYGRGGYIFRLFELAHRKALNVDAAIDEIMTVGRKKSEK